MAKYSTIISAAALGCLLAGCSAAPEKVLETSSIARKKPRATETAEAAPTARPALAQTCAQRHVDYQAGRNQPATLEEKQAMDAACASVH